MFFDSDIIKYYLGNIPIIITSQHDGYLTFLDNRELPMVFNVANDIGTRALVEKIAYSTRNNFCKPYILIYKIQKSRSNWDLYKKYLRRLANLTSLLIEVYNSCAVFDIHRFHMYPECKIQQNCDFIFGTDWRNNIVNNLDIEFANLLEDRLWMYSDKRYKIFVPPREKIEGARFAASGKTPERIIQSKWLKDKVPQVSAVQIEIYKDLLDDSNIRNDVAYAFADSVCQICNIL